MNSPRPTMSQMLGSKKPRYGIGKPALSAKPTHGIGTAVTSSARGGKATPVAATKKPSRKFWEDGSPLKPNATDDASSVPAAMPPNGRTAPYYSDPRKADADRRKGHFA